MAGSEAIKGSEARGVVLRAQTGWQKEQYMQVDRMSNACQSQAEGHTARLYKDREQTLQGTWAGCLVNKSHGLTTPGVGLAFPCCQKAEEDKVGRVVRLSEGVSQRQLCRWNSPPIQRKILQGWRIGLYQAGHVQGGWL